MWCRSFMLGALCASFALASVTPAFADDDGRHNEIQHLRRQEWRDREWRDHEWHVPPAYYAPPLVVAPPVYGYFGPPPVYHGRPAY